MFHVKHLLNQLTAEQRSQLKEFERQLVKVNTTVNLISRPSAADVQSKHILDCLALMQRDFPEKAVVVDWGTGAGLPAVPLAVVCPHVSFYGVEINRKKHFALRHFQRQLGLSNLYPWYGPAEQFHYSVDYSVARATTDLAQLWGWHQRVARNTIVAGPNQWAPGLVCRKGGDLSAELAAMHARFEGLTVEMMPSGDRQLVHVSGP